MKKLKQVKNKNHSIIAAISGAIIGSGVAVASALFFKDKKNRDKVKKVLLNTKDQVVNYVGKIDKEVKKNKKTVKKVTKK